MRQSLFELPDARRMAGRGVAEDAIHLNRDIAQEKKQ